MANLPETSNFDSGVFQLETTTLVLGGVAGPANSSAQNLTNRTRWLFNQNAANVTAISGLNTSVASINSTILTIGADIVSIDASISTINSQLSSINGQLPLLAPKASPSFSGTPTAPTQSVGNSSTLLATTAFVNPNSVTTGGGPWHRENPDGTIEQWGQFTYSTHSGSHFVSFGISFGIVQGVFLQEVASTIGWDTWIVAGSETTTGFQVTDDASSANTVTLNWRAIGTA